MAEYVIHCHKVEDFNEQLQQSKESKKLTVVDFTATWCGPCRMIAPVFDELAKNWTNVTFLKVDVDELRDIAQEYSVQAMPTFMFFLDGKVVDKIVGARKDDLPKFIEKYADGATATASA